jgi:GNAT superfamily N-acetyltransferase
MKIRPARGDDFEAVTALLEALGRPTVTDETRADCRAVFEQQVVDPRSHHSVAETSDGDIVGFCSMHFRARLNHPTDEAWIPDLIVREEARGAGIGRKLMEEQERRARSHGCHVLALESAYFRAEAHAFYLSLKLRDSAKAFVKQL